MLFAERRRSLLSTKQDLERPRESRTVSGQLAGPANDEERDNILRLEQPFRNDHKVFDGIGDRRPRGDWLAGRASPHRPGMDANEREAFGIHRNSA